MHSHSKLWVILFDQREPPVPVLLLFNAESINQSLVPVLSKTINKNQRVSWKNRQFFNCLVYFWESHSSCIEFNSSNILRTNQWASQWVYTRVDNRQVSVSLSKNHPMLVFKIPFPLPYLGLGGAWACFLSPFGTFFLRGHLASCNKNLICSHECFETFKASTNFFDQPLFPRLFLIISSLALVGKNYNYVLFAGKIKLTLLCSSHPIDIKLIRNKMLKFLRNRKGKLLNV
jgi:hypothetical protein